MFLTSTQKCPLRRIYHVAVEGEATRSEISARLVALAGDMMMEFDAMPTGVDPTLIKMEFANSIGIFRCLERGSDFVEAETE